MPLESLGRDPKLNVKNFEVPEPENRQDIFDARQYMTDKDWEIVERTLVAARLSNAWRRHAQVPGILSELFPDQAERFKAMEGFSSDLLGELREAPVRVTVRGMIDAYYTLKILFPDEAKKWAAGEMYAELLRLQSKSFYENLDDGLHDKAIADIEYLIKLDPKSLSERGQQMYPALIANLRSVIHPDDLVHEAAALKLAFPREFRTADIADIIDLDDPQKYIQAAREFSDLNNSTRVLQNLLGFKVLKAQNVKMTERGIVFGDEAEPKFKTDIPPLPELRK